MRTTEMVLIALFLKTSKFLPATLQTMIFHYNYKSNDVFYSTNSFYKVYLTALKNSKLK